MNLVLQPILKLLSRPVVCTNFQGLETNTYFSASALAQGYSTAKFLKLYVRVVNSIHFMQNCSVSKVKIRSDKSITFSKNQFGTYFQVLFVGLDQMHHLRPFAAPGQKNKLVEISQNYFVIFTENSEYLTSNACNFIKKIFLCLFFTADCSP